MLCSQEVSKEVQPGQQSNRGQVHWLRRQQQGLPHNGYSDTEGDRSKERDFWRKHSTTGWKYNERGKWNLQFMEFPSKGSRGHRGNNTKKYKRSCSCRGHDEYNGQTVGVQPASAGPKREIRVPKRYGLAYTHAADDMYPGEPGSYREARTSPEKDKWQTATQYEVNSLNKNSTLTLVDRPKDRKVINGRWVYKIKTDEQGNIHYFKAGYVEKGFMQVPGLDFHET